MTETDELFAYGWRWKRKFVFYVLVIGMAMFGAGRVTAHPQELDGYIQWEQHATTLFFEADNPGTWAEVMVNLTTPHGWGHVGGETVLWVMWEVEVESGLSGGLVQVSVKWNGTVQGDCAWSHTLLGNSGEREVGWEAMCRLGSYAGDGDHTLSVKADAAGSTAMDGRLSVTVVQRERVGDGHVHGLETQTVKVDVTAYAWLLWIAYAALLFVIPSKVGRLVGVLPGYAGVLMLSSDSLQFLLLFSGHVALTLLVLAMWLDGDGSWQRRFR